MLQGLFLRPGDSLPQTPRPEAALKQHASSDCSCSAPSRGSIAPGTPPRAPPASQVWAEDSGCWGKRVQVTWLPPGQKTTQSAIDSLHLICQARLSGRKGRARWLVKTKSPSLQGIEATNLVMHNYFFGRNSSIDPLSQMHESRRRWALWDRACRRPRGGKCKQTF